MKVLYCAICQDLIKLDYEERSCACGKAKGYYKEDGDHVVVSKMAFVIGIDNSTLRDGLDRLEEEPRFEAWLFSPHYFKIERRDW